MYPAPTAFKGMNRPIYVEEEPSIQIEVCLAGQMLRPNGGSSKMRCLLRDYLQKLRYRNVTICALVQSLSGLKVVSLVPWVTSFATDHMTASP